MIYVEILGRMGNQMFSYAMARMLQSKNMNQKIAFDFSNFEYKDDTWMNYIFKFKCSYNVCEEKRKLNILQKALLHIFYKKRNKINNWSDLRKFEDKYTDFLQIFGIYIYSVGYHRVRYKSMFKNKIVMGFYESSKYFDEIKDTIIDDFQVEIKNDYAENIIKDILNYTAIAVGVRRGDFTSKENKNFCDVCSPLYYEDGIKILYDKLKYKKNSNIKVYFFTDDIEWTKENIKCDLPKEYITSSISGQLKPWEMVYIISKCRYHVISNSSFFWWGQYLNNDKDKLVIAPARWRNENSEVYRDIYEDNWICISPR